MMILGTFPITRDAVASASSSYGWVFYVLVHYSIRLKRFVLEQMKEEKK